VVARGFTVLEAVVALAVLTILATGVVVNDRAQLEGVQRSYLVLAASRFAAGHLEENESLRPRERAIACPLPGCTATESVRRIRSGLFELAVVVKGPAGQELARLTTRRIDR
jgi:hypothetical protein